MLPISLNGTSGHRVEQKSVRGIEIYESFNYKLFHFPLCFIYLYFANLEALKKYFI